MNDPVRDPAASSVAPASVADVQEAVLYAAPGAAGEGPVLRPVGGGTKTALSGVEPADVRLDLSQLTGMLEYQPDECTFTALAGTRIDAVEALLAEHGQCLPFEPPFATRGATLGGTVASGLNGPGRFHYGGVRDFLIGARFVDGEGRLVRGGGRVVKNAAGFYLHHLLLGSLGRLGVLVEVTFKVFPRPLATATLEVSCGSLSAALTALAALRCSAHEVDAVDLTPPGTLHVRIGGAASALGARLDALAAVLRRCAGRGPRRSTDQRGVA